MYCPECGTKLDDDALFCPECGTKVAGLMADSTAPAQQPRPEPENGEREPRRSDANGNQPLEAEVLVSGFILINSYTISKRFCVDREQVIADANHYAEALRPMGVKYQVLDASDYTYKKKGLFGTKRVSLGQGNAWYEYADITKDAYDEEIRLKHKEPEYLFIIGGDEDIPMPLMPHFMDNAPDQDIDTDLLYSYPYGKQMGEKYAKMEIFQYDALFYVGRLPIATDGRYEDILNYYHRAIDNALQVQMDTAFTQCDPHWKAITNEVTRSLYQNNFYPRYQTAPPEQTYYGEHIWLTPYVMVDPDTRKQNIPAFNTEATYFFFNMHGGAQMDAKGYYGVAMDQDVCVEGMAPEMVKTAKRPNMFFSEACYGGRFIDYPKSNSMLLTAISSNTLTFVGSSRVAFGALDSQGIHLSNADIMGRVFTDNLLGGTTAGVAIMAARMSVFKAAPYEPMFMTTIAEFNLYGDPLMSMALPQKRKSYSTDKSARPAPKPGQRVASTETLMNKSVGDNKPQSLLDQVRSAVDKNILDIAAVMAKQLYEQYNIPAREPSIVKRRTYDDGHKDLSFVFPMEDHGQIINQAIVTSSEGGDIQQVITSK